MALDYTVIYNGLTIGNGTNVQIMKLTGVEDLPDLRTSDVDLGFADGEIAGQDWANGRDVAIDFLILDTPGAGDFFSTIAAVKAAFVKALTESTLLLQLPGRASRSIVCRPRRRSIPVSDDYQFHYGAGSVEFHATDPRIYDTVPLSWSLPVFVAGTAGVKLSLGAGADLGHKMTLGAGADIGVKMSGISGAGLVNASNAGTVATYPQIVFSAPAGMSSWTVTNQTTGQVMTINQTLNPGESLIADMMVAATGKPGLPISIGGVSRYGSWQSPRTPFALVPGLNVLRFDVAAGDPNAAALVTAQSAYL